MIRKSTNELLIKPKVSPPARIAALTAAILLTALVIFFAYNQGIKSGHLQYEQDRDLIKQLNSNIVDLRQDLSDSEQNLIVAERHKQIQEEAYKQISAAYASSEQKNRYLGSRLDFYRSIISPEDGQTGPAIQSLEMREESSNVMFDVTLVQAIKHKHQVRGNLRVSLYAGDELLGEWPESGPRSINFQYFQQISGVIESATLSENARMKAELQLQDGELIERWFSVTNN